MGSSQDNCSASTQLGSGNFENWHFVDFPLRGVVRSQWPEAFYDRICSGFEVSGDPIVGKSGARCHVTMGWTDGQLKAYGKCPGSEAIGQCQPLSATAYCTCKISSKSVDILYLLWKCGLQNAALSYLTPNQLPPLSFMTCADPALGALGKTSL